MKKKPTVQVKREWEVLTRNSVLRGNGFYVSYNANTENGHSELLNSIANIFGGDVRDGEETALYHKKSDKWYILEGDFRKEYEKAIGSFSKCLAVYKANKDKRSNWSTD